MLYKRKWFDGLEDEFAHLDEFELKRYCFGGDGGGSNGSSARTNTKTDDKTEVLQNVQSVASQSLDNKETERLRNEIMAASSGAPVGPAPQIVPGIGLAEYAVAPPSYSTGQTRPSIAQTASLSVAPSAPPAAGILSLPTAPVQTTDVMSAARNLGVPVVGNMVGAVQNAPVGAIPGTNTMGYVRPVAGGIAGIGTNLRGDLGIGYGVKF